MTKSAVFETRCEVCDDFGCHVIRVLVLVGPLYFFFFRALHAEKLYRYADFIVCQELAPAHRTKTIIKLFAACVITG